MSWKKVAAAVFALIVIMATIGIVKLAIDPPAPKLNKLTIAATIFPLADIIRQVGGQHVEVLALLKPGASEHAASLDPRDLALVQRAAIVFSFGHGLDDRLVGLVSKTKSVPVKVVDDDIAIRTFASEPLSQFNPANAADNNIDPHYWLTISNAAKIAATVARQLQELDPAHAENYAQNLTAYQQQLQVAETELQNEARVLKQKNFISMHNAWSYFAADYGLNLVGTYEPVEGAEPTALDLSRLKNIVEQFGIKTFYSEPQGDSLAANTLMRRDLGLRISYLDPIGGAKLDDSYIKMMRRNLAAIAAGQ